MSYLTVVYVASIFSSLVMCKGDKYATISVVKATLVKLEVTCKYYYHMAKTFAQGAYQLEVISTC